MKTLSTLNIENEKGFKKIPFGWRKKKKGSVIIKSENVFMQSHLHSGVFETTVECLIFKSPFCLLDETKKTSLVRKLEFSKIKVLL